MTIYLWIILLAQSSRAIHGLLFTKNPTNLTVTQGNTARLGCCVEGLSEPEIVWMKDGEKLYSTDQMYIPIEQHHWETFHSVKSVQQQDAGKYWCEVEFHGLTISSEPAWITVEGVPNFILEPQDVATFPGVPFNLTCAAVGPPDPVEVLWWLGGVQKGDATSSPSVLRVNGKSLPGCFSLLDVSKSKSLSFSLTAVLPAAPKGVQVVHMVDNNVTLAWSPGFTGHSDLSACTIQVELLDQRVKVPPFQQILSGLSCYSNYSVRVCCDNEVGTSLFSGWLDFQTPEAGGHPANRIHNDISALLFINSFFVIGCAPNVSLFPIALFMGPRSKVVHYLGNREALFFKENVAHLSGGGRFFNATFHVSACTVAGCGPWSQPVLVMPDSACHCRSVFNPPGNERLVSFTAARSFNRTCPELPESSLDSLGINNDLKAKLQDVLIPERLLTLGHMLGKGEFGSVREAFLKMEDSTVQKVAVKVLKTDINSSCDIEQCLKEASHMKDFDHPNVIQLIGVSLHSRPQQRLPIPMVILPFMKHGDLHTFLLLSRLGDEPFTVSLQMLIQFMLDIARGMAYLSNKSIIHRDLAARNCMLSENLTVCVADFGLSKKIYSGDYYRQGSVSKLPVKWIALESLADNVYTTQSDVWAFGVTMWEIMARGQTPYPGVENSEIYEYLIKGERLKQPPDCRDNIYEIMHSCWSPVPKCRPSFLHLIDQLEGLWASLSPGPSCIKEALLYVNLENDKGEQGAGALGPRKDPFWSGMPWQCVGMEEDEKDWLVVSSGAALAVGGDYRYIIGPTCHGTEEDGGRQGDSMDTLQPDVRDEEYEDAFINV
uniref:Tyrosine-protein kinase receptor TYRO3 n=1 Tax=Oncorhynchus kisutch TaxID=8019 RepID=A0A8C7HFX8_ONCKI